MRGHKFVVIVGDNEHMFDTQRHDGFVDIEDLEHQMTYNEDTYLRVVTCPFESWKDNMIKLVNKNDKEDTYSVMRDINGRLWAIDDVMSRMDIINAFEQTDG